MGKNFKTRVLFELKGFELGFLALHLLQNSKNTLSSRFDPEISNSLCFVFFSHLPATVKFPSKLTNPHTLSLTIHSSQRQRWPRASRPFHWWRRRPTPTPLPGPTRTSSPSLPVTSSPFWYHFFSLLCFFSC